MSPFDMDDDGFSLHGVGLTIDDLDLTLFASPDTATPIKPSWKPSEWWETTDQEYHFTDLPRFHSAGDRARYFVEEMGRAYLRTMGQTDDYDAEVFPYAEGMVSLNELLRIVTDSELGLNDLI
jgi:hypothetical protein